VSTSGSPSRPPIRIGIIGATPARGWGTAAHLPALAALEEFEVTAVSTTRLTTARATAEVFAVPLAFADDDELVSHPDVDAVAITVKVPEHDRLVRAALAAGKHVFSECRSEPTSARRAPWPSWPGRAAYGTWSGCRDTTRPGPCSSGS